VSSHLGGSFDCVLTLVILEWMEWVKKNGLEGERCPTKKGLVW
jgi:hypothetical protein